MNSFRRALREFFHPTSDADLQQQWNLTQAHREAEAARAEAAALRTHLDKLREPTAVDLMASQTRIDKAATELHLIAEGGPDRWRMSIPARLGHDSEPVIGAGLHEGDRLVREVGQLRDLVTDILGRFTHPGHPGEPCVRTGWIPEKQITAWRLAAGPVRGYARGGVVTPPTTGDDR